MPDPQPIETGDLPDAVAIMVVDTEQFSRHNDVQQDELAKLLVDVVEDSFQRCGLAEVRETSVFADHTGDGYLLGFSPRFLPAVIDQFLGSLQQELATKLPRLKGQGMRLRMRLSLEMGPARPLDDPRLRSPVGNAMIATHRLVDAEPLRALLKRSDPEVTLLVVALSERVMQDVVHAGHTRHRRATEFVDCAVDLPAKGYAGTAYLHVPTMSGELLRHGLLGAQAPAGDEAAIEDASRPTAPSVKRGVSGSSYAVAGRDVDQSRHQTTVHGDQNNAGRDLNNAGRDVNVRRGRQR